MLHYYFGDSTHFSLQERMQRVATCKMVKGMLIMNIGILFLIPILDLILEDMSYKVGLLSLIFVGLCLYVCLIAWISGHWDDQKQRMELKPLINALIIILTCSCAVAFYQNVFGGLAGWTAYLIPIGIGLLTLLIAIVTALIEQRHR